MFRVLFPSSSPLLLAAAVSRPSSFRVAQSCLRMSASSSSVVSSVRRLDSSYSENITRLFAHAFPMNDTYSWGAPLGYTDETFLQYFSSYVPEFFSKSDNVAMGILNTAEDDAEGNSLAGAILYEPFGDVEVDASKLEVSTSEPISAMMTTCRSRFLFALQERNPSLTEEQRASLKCGYIGWMAVHSSQRRKGICLTLVQQATREMALAGMSFIIAYCTSPKSRAVFLKAGYEVWAEVRYATFQVRENKYPGGEFPYRNVPDEVSIMVKDLRHALND